MLILSLILIVLLQREKFLQAHVRLSCFAIWILLTLFAIIPVLFKHYTSVLRLMGIVTFSIVTIHTTLPLPRSWTVLMASITSFLHFVLVIRTHYVPHSAIDRSQQMEFKLKVAVAVRSERARPTASSRLSRWRCSSSHAMPSACAIVISPMHIR